ncbi:hypothetical protein DICVIV_05997 [Dictyocaulus viviparus]|uniref:Uncharacterized protein n=1 Tax=Dictyocaulus viviparus TaxID=29172 RepID=A0A0D8XTT0_DICVI|nr:hypothetical protein DICVIV_05997 [Dictyocaulus viviparus]
MNGPPYSEFDKVANVSKPTYKLDQWANKMTSQILKTTREDGETATEANPAENKSPKCLTFVEKQALHENVVITKKSSSS